MGCLVFVVVREWFVVVDLVLVRGLLVVEEIMVWCWINWVVNFDEVLFGFMVFVLWEVVWDVVVIVYVGVVW